MEEGNVSEEHILLRHEAPKQLCSLEASSRHVMAIIHSILSKDKRAKACTTVGFPGCLVNTVNADLMQKKKKENGQLKFY